MTIRQLCFYVAGNRRQCDGALRSVLADLQRGEGHAARRAADKSGRIHRQVQGAQGQQDSLLEATPR